MIILTSFVILCFHVFSVVSKSMIKRSYEAKIKHAEDMHEQHIDDLRGNHIKEKNDIGRFYQNQLDTLNKVSSENIANLKLRIIARESQITKLEEENKDLKCRVSSLLNSPLNSLSTYSEEGEILL